MKRISILLVLLVVFIKSNFIFSQCQSGRFYDKQFNAIQTLNVAFGKNITWENDSQNLAMHIFQPEGDLLAHRPLIILAFGGSFTSGLKESPDILQLCREFAQRGYVTATIDYRIGVENGTDSARYKALIRGIQDMRAAIGFFHKDASTINAWRVDTTQIYIGGVSAGGFIGLNLAYYKQGLFSIEPPEWLDEVAESVGGLYASSGNQGYGQNIKGVVNLCGGIADTVWIYPGDPILCSVHGSADETVPWCKDSTNTSVTARFFGSQCIHARAERVNLVNDFRPFYGADHVPFVLPIPLIPPASLYMDTTIKFVRDFLYQHTICNPEMISSIQEDKSSTFTVYPNPTNDYIYFTADEAMLKNMDIEILDLQGKTVQKNNWMSELSLVHIPVTSLESGSYVLKMNSGNKVFMSRFQVVR